MTAPQLWPIFICYRRVDGIEIARRLHEVLDKWETSGPHGNPIQLDVYLDEEMPGVSNWKDLHRPYLEKARAMIVICTPGSKLNEGPKDYVHGEIEWWLKNRKTALILIDPLMEGPRFVPSEITQRYPDIQRILLVEKELSGLSQQMLKEKIDGIRRQIIGAILPSGADVYAQELMDERRRAQKLRRALMALSIILIFFLSLAAYTFFQRNVAVQERIRAKQAQAKA